MRYKFEVLSGRDISAVIEGLLSQCSNDPLFFLLLGGDRIAVCDEIVVLTARGRVLGVASIAPNGEENSGEPTIVALYVVPSARRGQAGIDRIGTKVMRRAVERCIERGFEQTHVQVFSPYAMKIINQLPEPLKARLEISNLSTSTISKLFD